MLRYLREQSGSWIIKIILGLIIIIFAFFFGVGGFGPKNRGPVAMVNDQPITFSEYKKSYEAIVQQIRTRLGDSYNDKILEQLNVKKTALDSLIEEKLVAGASEKLKIKITDKELAHSVNEYPYFQNNGQFDFNKYKDILARNSMTPEMFEFSQRKSLTQQKVKKLLFDTITISDMEALQWHEYLNTKVSINYLKFDPAQYTEIKPTQKELESYYDDNKDKYKTDVKLNVEYLLFSPDDYKDQIKATEKEVKQYYEENSELYSVPEKIEARHILIKTEEDADDDKIEDARKEALKIYDMAIDKKNDFSELAKKFSQGPSASNGGYLGSFAKSDMVKPFAEAAFAMDTGEISMPVKTKFGWHIIKVVAKFEPSTKTFKEVKDEIAKDIINKKISDLAYYEAGDAFDAVVDGDSLEQAGLLTNRKVLRAGPFTENGIGLHVKNSKKFVEAAFSTILNEISNIVEIDNSYYLIKPVEKIEPEIIEFEIVSDRVKADLLLKLQNEKAEKHSNKIILSLKENNSFEKIVKSENLKLETTEFFDRKGYIPGIGYAPSIADASFKLIEKDEIYPETIKIDNVFYIISLKGKSSPEGFKDNKEKKDIKINLENQKKQTVYAAWIDTLKATNEIKILKPELFE